VNSFPSCPNLLLLSNCPGAEAEATGESKSEGGEVDARLRFFEVEEDFFFDSGVVVFVTGVFVVEFDALCAMDFEFGVVVLAGVARRI
jgi:hypothetical protein